MKVIVSSWDRTDTQMVEIFFERRDWTNLMFTYVITYQIKGKQKEERKCQVVNGTLGAKGFKSTLLMTQITLGAMVFLLLFTYMFYVRIFINLVKVKQLLILHHKDKVGLNWKGSVRTLITKVYSCRPKGENFRESPDLAVGKVVLGCSCHQFK